MNKLNQLFVPILVILFLVLVVTACGDTPSVVSTATTAPTETQAPTNTADVPARPTVAPATATITASNTPTEIPTATETAAPTSTLTPTATPTIEPKGTLREDNVNIRSGPGVSYPVLTEGHQATQFSVGGRNSEGDWIEVLKVGNSPTGWVLTQFIDLSVDVSSLPIIAAPPTPVPTATPDTASAESQYRSDFENWCCGVGGYTESFGALYGSLKDLDDNPDKWYDGAWSAHVLFQLTSIHTISREISDYQNVPKRLKSVHDKMKGIALQLDGAADLFHLAINERSTSLINQAVDEVSVAMKSMQNDYKDLNSLLP